MGRPTIEWQSALVHAIDLPDLRRMGSGRKGEVSIATRLGEDLHLVIDPAVATAEGIREGPVAMHECVARRALTVPGRQAAVSRQGIPELRENPAGVFRSVGLMNPVVQMDLDLPPARP